MATSIYKCQTQPYESGRFYWLPYLPEHTQTIVVNYHMLIIWRNMLLKLEKAASYIDERLAKLSIMMANNKWLTIYDSYHYGFDNLVLLNRFFAKWVTPKHFERELRMAINHITASHTPIFHFYGSMVAKELPYYPVTNKKSTPRKNEITKTHLLFELLLNKLAEIEKQEKEENDRFMSIWPYPIDMKIRRS